MHITKPSARLRSAAVLAAATTFLAACGGGSSDTASSQGPANARVTLSLVAYAVPEPGWSKIIPAYNATPEGKDVAVTTSYGASGDQSRKVQDVLFMDSRFRPWTKTLIDLKSEKAKAPVYSYMFTYEYQINGGVTARWMRVMASSRASSDSTSSLRPRPASASRCRKPAFTARSTPTVNTRPVRR